MNSHSKCLLAVLLVCLALNIAQADDATLSWSNGDSLKGTLVRADDKVLVWRSPLFTDPLEINLSALHTIKFPDAAADRDQTVKAEPGFRILLKNGDLLFGNLKSIGESTLGFEGSRFGAFEVDRKQVLSLNRNTSTGGLIYSGPRGLDGWQPAFRRSPDDQPQRARMLIRGGVAVKKGDESEKTAPASWTEQPDGSLATTRPDAALFLPLTLPGKFEIEVELRSTKTLSFVMAVGRDAKAGLRLESWITHIVAANGTKFTTLQQLKDEDLTLHLHLFVDYPERTMSVYSRSGKKLGEVAISGLRGGAEGLMFRNGEWDLNIRRLRVSNWDGSEPKIATGDLTRVQMADGTLHDGELQTLNAETGMVSIQKKGVSIEVLLEDITSLIASTGDDDAAEAPTTSAEIVWNDGTTLSGTLLTVDENTAVMRSPVARDPVQCSLYNVARLGLTPTVLPPTQLDRLFHSGGSLQGSLVVDGEAANPIQWTPLGGNNASTLKNGDDARFIRGASVTHFSEHPEMLTAFPDVIYLTNNDVLPCRVEVYSEEVITLSLPFSQVKTFPRKNVRAVELSATGRIHQRGFGAEGWKGVGSKRKPAKVIADHEKSAAEKSGNDKTDGEKHTAATEAPKAVLESIQLRGNASVSHPSILTGDTVRFHLKWPVQSYANVTVSLFGSGNRKDDDATHVAFTLMQTNLQVLDRAPAQDQMFFRGFGGQNADGIIRAPQGEADIQLVARDGSLLVSVDGKQVKTIKLNSAGAGSKGLAFNANVAMMGNVVINGRVQQGKGDAVEVSAFEVDNMSGASIRQFIAEEARQATLTVPRFRRDNPPTHVLVAANGDLLRGKLTGISDTAVQFESRLENLKVDRERVAAIVWLDPPKKDSGKKQTQRETTKPPANAVSNVPGAELHATDSPATDTPAQVDVAQTAPATDRAIAANPKPAVEKPDSAPPVADDEENGFVMGDDGEASMQAQLADGFSITMTPASLVDGQIKGRSKLLGDCTFPAASIRELFLGNPKNRDSSPAYQNWIAKNAQEPDWDVAAADGGSSAGAKMVGTVADDFELPLLDGTKFRLRDHADKIVVLDFWATWCGPCVAALPDYIAATSEFDSSKVIFVAVNQQEASDQIRGFLTEKSLSPTVGLDRNGDIAQKFHVSGIPHTVILGRGNVVEDVHVGYQQGGGESMQIAIQQLLDGTWKRPAPEAEPATKPQEKPADAI